MANREADRIHSMDALRASTMLLLVPVHASAILALNGHPGNWSVAVFWLIHVFRLPLFFAMSGFFFAFLIGRKGVRETLRNRSLRIAVPLAVGLVTVVPLFYLAGEVTGVTVTGGDGHSSESGGFGLRLSYLWFLWYLLIIDAFAFLTYLAAPRLLAAASRGMGRLLSSPILAVVGLAAPTALILLAQPEWAGLPATSGFLPEPAVLAYDALFFVLGASLCAHRGAITAARDRAWTWAAGAAALTLAAGLLFTQHDNAFGERALVHYPSLAVDALATIVCLFALIGLANRYLDRRRPRLRYLADSSYWIYLSHMPAVVLLVALVGTTAAIGTAAAFVVVTAGAIAFSLVTYPLFVRYTIIGRVLNGPRRRPRQAPAPITPAEQPVR